MANKRRYTHTEITTVRVGYCEKQIIKLLGLRLSDMVRVGILAGIVHELETRADEIPADLLEQFHADCARFEMHQQIKRVKPSVDTVMDDARATTTTVTQCEHIAVWDMDFDRRETIPAHKFNPAIHRRIAVEVEQCLN